MCGCEKQSLLDVKVVHLPEQPHGAKTPSQCPLNSQSCSGDLQSTGKGMGVSGNAKQSMDVPQNPLYCGKILPGCASRAGNAVL